MKAAFVLLLWGAAFGAQAQSVVYRCGNVYSDSPCPQARVVDAADPRSEEQRLDARRVTAEQKELGREMERQRLALAAQRPAGATSLSGTPPRPEAPTKRKRIKARPKPKAVQPV